MVFEGIFRLKFIMGRNYRSINLQNIYHDNGFLGHPIDLTRMNVRDAANPTGRPSRVKVYRFRRLPAHTRQASEMRPPMDWLQKIGDKGALRMSWRDAFGVFLEAIRSYRYVTDGEARYIGFPPSIPRVLRRILLAMPGRYRRKTWFNLHPRGY